LGNDLQKPGWVVDMNPVPRLGERNNLDMLRRRRSDRLGPSTVFVAERVGLSTQHHRKFCCRIWGFQHAPEVLAKVIRQQRIDRLEIHAKHNAAAGFGAQVHGQPSGDFSAKSGILYRFEKRLA